MTGKAPEGTGAIAAKSECRGAIERRDHGRCSALGGLGRCSAWREVQPLLQSRIGPQVQLDTSPWAPWAPWAPLFPPVPDQLGSGRGALPLRRARPAPCSANHLSTGPGRCLDLRVVPGCIQDFRMQPQSVLCIFPTASHRRNLFWITIRHAKSKGKPLGTFHS